MLGAHAVLCGPFGNEVAKVPLEVDSVIDAGMYVGRYTATAAVRISYALVKVKLWEDDYEKCGFGQTYNLMVGDTLNFQGPIRWDD